MIDTTDLRKNVKVTIDGYPYVVIEAQFVKPGKGQAFTRTKMKNMITGNMLERTYKTGERLEKADMEERSMQYTYMDGDMYVFMDVKNYEEVRITADQLGDNRLFLLDNVLCEVLFFDGKPIGITPPIFVEMDIIETEPGFKGDTSGNTTKPAKVTSGLIIHVPLFVNQGERVKIDTRTGEYVERVKK